MLCHGTLPLTLLFPENNLFTFIDPEEKQKGQNCQNLTMAWCFTAYLLGTVSNSIVALCNCQPLLLDTPIFPLSRMVFCISLKGTFMQDVRRAESLSHFPCVVAPSRSGNENVSLTRAPGCCSALTILCLPGPLEGHCLACGWMHSSLHPQLQLHHFSGQCHSALSKTDFRYKGEI